MRKIYYYLNVNAVVLGIGLQALVSHKTMSFVLGRTIKEYNKYHKDAEEYFSFFSIFNGEHCK